MSFLLQLSIKYECILLNFLIKIRKVSFKIIDYNSVSLLFYKVNLQKKTILCYEYLFYYHINQYSKIL